MINTNLVKELRDRSGAGVLDCKKALEEKNGDIEEAMKYLREKGVAKAAKKSERIAAEGLASILIKDNKAIVLEMNSETDFVAKNETFKSLVEKVMEVILNSDVKTVSDALNLSCEEGTLNDLIIAKTATIGEKLSLRRFERVTLSDNEVVGSYIHMGGKIASLVVLKGANSEVASNVAMHAAAMRPLYVKESSVPTDALEKEKSIMREQLINEGKPADKIDNILSGKVKKYYEEVCLENQIYVKAENKETVAKYVSQNNGEIINMIRFEVGEGIEKKEENFAEEVAAQLKNN
ncbi:MAG: translation elongation factor Ts [Clostridium sp.]|nr:translation elongation factor Ts [Clostridium sp.]MCM1444693.1 translation elongation factor Ts [Candidatus Amulumruptor caecigallinarius]